jgi:hypothetical protein
MSRSWNLKFQISTSTHFPKFQFQRRSISWNFKKFQEISIIIVPTGLYILYLILRLVLCPKHIYTCPKVGVPATSKQWGITTESNMNKNEDRYYINFNLDPFLEISTSTHFKVNDFISFQFRNRLIFWNFMKFLEILKHCTLALIRHFAYN